MIEKEKEADQAIGIELAEDEDCNASTVAAAPTTAHPISVAQSFLNQFANLSLRLSSRQAQVKRAKKAAEKLVVWTLFVSFNNNLEHMD